MEALDRRVLMRRGIALAAGASLSASASPSSAAEAEVDTGAVRGGKVEFPTWVAPTERPSGGPPGPLRQAAASASRSRDLAVSRPRSLAVLAQRGKPASPS